MPDRDPSQMPAEELRREVESVEWYHTFELAPGVVTPGWLDHREIAARMPIPKDLTGKRCLDVATFDGFWAFEMERRGGDVVGIDILDAAKLDWPADAGPEMVEAMDRRKRAGDGFELVKSALGSSVERQWVSIYDLNPESIGEFDCIYLGSLLVHLRDPIGALMAVRSVCRGTLVVADAYSPIKTLLNRRPVAGLEAAGRPWWWRPNIKGLERMIDAAGFKRTAPTTTLRFPAGRGRPSPPVNAAVLRSPQARQELIDVRFGDSHAIIVAE